MIDLETQKLPSYDRLHRVYAIDALRGFAMVYIMLYHLFYDLITFAGVSLPFFSSGWWNFIHIFFVSLLFVVSGISTHFSRNSLKRGVLIFFFGQLITLITAIASNITRSDEIIIVFGVLTFIGLAMMIYSIIRPAVEKLDMPPVLLFIISILLYVIFLKFPPHQIFSTSNLWLYPLGIFNSQFRSADYFPLVPYFFIFLAGTAISAPITGRRFPKFFYKARALPLEFIGRHSLLFYIVHQPAILLVLFLLGVIKLG
ncbi:MAG: DUF1624 domain-containing protein [Ruminococcus sp.]|jgi:uncharacterized membrane protein|nr:DUF1624 domain-containing protein [Ruminococcus sp.]